MISLLLAASLAAPDLRLDYARQSLVKTVRHYRQYVDGREVVGGERIVEERNGVVRVVYERLAAERPDHDRAHVSAVCDGCVYVNVDGQARLARREIVKVTPLQPHAIYTDVQTGAVLRDDPMFFAAVTVQARVFEVNPVTKLNDPTLRDHNNAASAVPDAAYSNVFINDVQFSTPLTGLYDRIVDTQAPFTVHADPTQLLQFDRSQPQFEEVNAFFHIDRAQRYLVSLGYVGQRRLVDYAIPIDAHAADGSDNSFYLQQSPPGHGALFFGDGGTDDAEDPDIMLHEFFHAVQDWIAPGALAGPANSEARALSEATADYWSFSSSYAASVISGRDPYCIAEWDARCGGDDSSQQCGYAEGTDCLRRVDSPRTMSDYSHSTQPGTEYENAAIWSSALREIFLKIGKPAADTLVIESLFGMPPLPSFKLVAQKMIEADAALNGGANASAICSAMTSRGILSTSDCFAAPRGEWTYVTSHDANVATPDAGAAIESSIVVTDARAVDRVAVRVDIDHPVRGDLVITLVAPNGVEVTLKNSLDVDRTPGVHATFGLDAPSASSLDVLHGLSAAGTWKLRVQDVFAGDVGKLQSWSLVLQFAGDAPLTARPAAERRQVIPDVAHTPGALGSLWTSDVRLFNRTASAQTATLIFTPTGHDGTTDFAALKFTIDPQQVVYVVDVVAQMRMLGSGQLEIDGDVVASARIHGGGYEIEPAVPVPNGPTSSLLLLRYGAEIRANLGFAETAGQPALVTWNDGSVVVPPFGHVQVRAPERSSVLVTSAGSVVAYAAMVDNASNDPIFEIDHHDPAGALRYAVGPNVPGDWHTDILIGPSTISARFIGIGIALVEADGPAFGSIVRSSRFGESMPFFTDTLESGDLVGVENSPAFHTNIVLANIRATPQTITLRDFTAGGQLLRTQTGVVPPLTVLLLPLETSAARVHVDGDILAYASVIDNSNGDPMLIPLQ